MSESDEYDVIVVGGGPAGENAAQYAVQGSDRTAAIVESELLGGECSYFACIPSKAMLRPLDVRAVAAHLGGLSGVPDVDVEGLLARRDSWVAQYDDAGQVSWAEGAGLTVVRGHGRLTGERTVAVGDRTLTAREAVVIATGSVGVIPPVLAGLAPWTSRDATGVREVPEHLVIVGGGVVSCEAARWMRALGSRVTLLVRGQGVLAPFEPFAGSLVLDALRADGIDVRLDTEVSAATRDAAEDTGLGRIHGGEVRLTLSSGERIEATELLVATGRRPATDGLGLEAVGLTADDLRGAPSGGSLPDWLHTVGDINAEAPLTHWGKYQARMVGARIAARAGHGTEPVAPAFVPVPQVVFTDPQVAAVGLTARQAEAAGRAFSTRDQELSSTTGAVLLRDDLVGSARLVVDDETDTLIGATFVGPEVGDLVHAATIAIVGQVPLDVLRHAVPSYPTSSEIWLRLLEG
ncbi:dihydrolipoyl dehydrogenase family protein [Nocardioides sp. LHG3406-4]|uniref:dihydrolipoyl dehydrogenase family protein n=1 Tax=Nocardioides sp. LHG3406-4 TaxID=2804575 RepID=UPI003CEB765E